MVAQLRDKDTSDLIAEGSPLASAIAAERIGFDEVLFDGFGGPFDPTSFLIGHRIRVAALRDLARQHRDDVDDSTIAREIADEAVGLDLVQSARDKIKVARDRARTRRAVVPRTQ